MWPTRAAVSAIHVVRSIGHKQIVVVENSFSGSLVYLLVTTFIGLCDWRALINYARRRILWSRSCESTTIKWSLYNEEKKIPSWSRTLASTRRFNRVAMSIFRRQRIFQFSVGLLLVRRVSTLVRSLLIRRRWSPSAICSLPLPLIAAAYLLLWLFYKLWMITCYFHWDLFHFHFVYSCYWYVYP